MKQGKDKEQKEKDLMRKLDSLSREMTTLKKSAMNEALPLSEIRWLKALHEKRANEYADAKRQLSRLTKAGRGA